MSAYTCTCGAGDCPTCVYVRELEAAVRGLDGAAITRDIAGFKGEADYIYRDNGDGTSQRIDYTIFDAERVLAASPVTPSGDDA